MSNLVDAVVEARRTSEGTQEVLLCPSCNAPIAPQRSTTCNVCHTELRLKWEVIDE
jgi:ribosomal protein L40E